MGLTIIIVALLGLLALAIVGAAAFVEVRPVVQAYRRRRRLRPPVPEDTLQIPVPRRARHAHDTGASGAVVSALLGLGLFAFGVWEWSRFGFGGEWLTTEGTALDARLEATGPDSASLRAVLEYRYVVGGQAFVARWADAEQTLLTGFVEPDELMALYRRGDPITVWYHPLLPNFPSLSRVSLWYVALFFALGAFLIVRALAALLARAGASRRRDSFPNRPGLRRDNPSLPIRSRG